MSNIIAAAEIQMQTLFTQDTVLIRNAKFFKNLSRAWYQVYWCFSKMIEKMGDKATAKSTMIEAGVPYSRF